MRAARLLLAAGRLCVVSLLLAGTVPARLPAQADTSGVPPADWLTYNRTLEGDRHSPLDQITARNVAQLRRVCTYDLRDSLSFQTEPVVVDGTEWNGPSYHPGMNLLVVGAVDRCAVMRRMHPDSLTAERGEVWAGGEDPNPFGIFDEMENSRGWITAVDADSGTVRWKHEADLPTIAGVTTTAGGLVFTGQLSGEAVALDAQSGRVLWSDQTNNAISGGVVTYAVNGKQYVALAAGLHAANWPAPAETNRIVVYALP